MTWLFIYNIDKRIGFLELLSVSCNSITQNISGAKNVTTIYNKKYFIFHKCRVSCKKSNIIMEASV